MSSHRSASGPCARRARSARCARWVTSRQKSRAGPVTRWAASAGPYVHNSPDGATSSTRNSSPGTVSPRTPKAKSRARTPMRATCFSRSVGARITPNASATSCPWAQVSIRRPVAIEATDMGGPYQGNRVPVGAARRASSRAARPDRHAASSRAGGSAAPSSAPSSTNPSGAASAFSTSLAKASASVTASSAARSVQARWAIWWAMVHPGAGVATAHRPSPNSPTSRSSSSLSRHRSSITDDGSDTMRSPRGTTLCVPEHGSGHRNNQACLH